MHACAFDRLDHTSIGLDTHAVVRISVMRPGLEPAGYGQAVKVVGILW